LGTGCLRCRLAAGTITGRGYDDPLVDEAVGVLVETVANGDVGLTHVYFDVSGVAGLGKWEQKADLVAARIRQLGTHRILYVPMAQSASTHGSAPQPPFHNSRYQSASSRSSRTTLLRTCAD
jgi:hypothetical protein